MVTSKEIRKTYKIGKTQLFRWVRDGLLPQPTVLHLGKGRGTSSTFPDSVLENLSVLCKVKGRSLETQYLALWMGQCEVDPSRVRGILLKSLSALIAPVQRTRKRPQAAFNLADTLAPAVAAALPRTFKNLPAMSDKVSVAHAFISKALGGPVYLEPVLYTPDKSVGELIGVMTKERDSETAALCCLSVLSVHEIHDIIESASDAEIRQLSGPIAIMLRIFHTCRFDVISAKYQPAFTAMLAGPLIAALRKYPDLTSGVGQVQKDLLSAEQALLRVFS